MNEKDIIAKELRSALRLMSERIYAPDTELPSSSVPFWP